MGGGWRNRDPNEREGKRERGRERAERGERERGERERGERERGERQQVASRSHSGGRELARSALSHPTPPPESPYIPANDAVHNSKEAVYNPNEAIHIEQGHI